jgi:predicted RNA polymerase sigma factor
VQAAIAAVHAEATSTDTIDWAQILGLYALLEDLQPSPVVTLNRAIALAKTRGPRRLPHRRPPDDQRPREALPGTAGRHHP